MIGWRVLGGSVQPPNDHLVSECRASASRFIENTVTAIVDGAELKGPLPDGRGLAAMQRGA